MTGSGHRLVSHTADCIIEAWGPDRASCATEALAGLVDVFASAPGDAPSRPLPLAAQPAAPEDQLVSLLEDVIYTVEVLAVVPVRFHLSETAEGGLAGDMEVVGLEHVETQGPVPKAVSYHDLSMRPENGEWRGHVLIDV